MNLDFNSYPLDIYNQEASKSLLKTMNGIILKHQSSHSSNVMNSVYAFITKAAGYEVLSFLNGVVIDHRENKILKSLSMLHRQQIITVKNDPSTFLKEAQLNLLITSVLTQFLAHKEFSSYGNAAKNLVKFVSSSINNFSFERALEDMNEIQSNTEEKYEEICEVFFIAFLLRVYSYNLNTVLVTQLIDEAFRDDEDGTSSYYMKRRPILFSDNQYKSAVENCIYNIDNIREGAKRYPEVNGKIKNYL